MQEGDYSGLMEVMGHLMAVKERQDTTNIMFEPLQQTITLLKMYEQELPEVVYKQLEVKTNIPHFFSNIRTDIFQLRQLLLSYLILCLHITDFLSAFSLLSIHHLRAMLILLCFVFLLFKIKYLFIFL